jgi:hypothetical protein
MQHPDRPFPPVPRPTEVAFTVEQPDGSTARLRIEFDLFVDRLAGCSYPTLRRPTAWSPTT